MPVSRGEFLKQLGKSIPGMVLGGGVAGAAHKILSKIAAVSGEMKPLPVVEKKVVAQEAKIEFIKSGPTTGNRIALTFDDGPSPGVTDLILDELARRQVKATFFMIGQNVAANPDLARRVLAEGHEVANHTYTHVRLTTLPDKDVIAEIEKTQTIMQEVLNYRPIWFRPPFAEFRQNQAAIPSSRGLGIVLLDVDTRDWAQPGTDEIISRALENTKAGSIILCHDLYRQTVDSVGPLLDGLIEKSFEFGTISELLLSPATFSK
jgi:peptidoglycan-N-acetylglucosamine deacetylase